MKTKINITQKLLFIVFSILIIIACDREETLQPTAIFENGEPESTTEIDQFLKKEFRDPYGSVIHYKFVDKFIDPTKSATPPRIDVVQPIAELIKQAWIEPYNKASNQGGEFLGTYFPAEIVILGSPLFNSNGTITLGVADSGVRVTLTQANEYTPDNTAWIVQTFRTLHHEFAHIIDQNFKFDIESFFRISEDNYTSSGTWFNLSDEQALQRGMVTPYATSSPAEDFAETMAYIITTEPDVFEATYITPETCDGTPGCIARNEGKARIKEKYDVIIKYMKEDVGIDVNILRDEFLNSIN
ncbi:substrate import-associated zinc metallohydrolase lipoprotein [Aquimarina sp. I32.4]|uniref:substrate import-associated zinc metallohydrolase lipoprotein n=1 Tax=Aquimarina sp. I32.4 TaxID=2053903 RepID=UPI000CDEB8C9|nr:substrate import-associated zinc metallohydrolase lipoprotein [Aquimarina sp. I32.4]